MHRYRIGRRIGAKEDLGGFDGLGPLDALACMLRGKGVPVMSICGELRFLDARDITMHAPMHYDVRYTGRSATCDALFTVWLRTAFKTEDEAAAWRLDPIDDRVWPQGVHESKELWLVVARDVDDAAALVALHTKGHRVTADRPNPHGLPAYSVGRGRGEPVNAPPKKRTVKKVTS